MVAKKSENSNKRILYLAFNKAIVNEIRKKKPKNLFPHTFDAFIRQLYINRSGEYNITDLNTYTFGQLYTWFQNKSFKMKKAIIKKYNNFCKDIKHTEMFTFLNIVQMEL